MSVNLMRDIGFEENDPKVIEARRQAAAGDTLHALAESEAEKRYPHEHVGYSADPPRNCSCDECYGNEARRLAYVEGFVAGRTSVTEEEIMKLVASEGWTCEYHEPDEMCIQCERMHRQLARKVLAVLRGETGDESK